MERQVIELNQDWTFIKKAEGAEDAVRKALANEGQIVTLPHTWNAEDGQDGGNDYYRGTCWYVRTIMPEELTEEGRKDPAGDAADRVYFLDFQAAAYTSEVFVNGELRSHHEDGFSDFRVDITEEVRRGQAITLAVSCDNSDSDHVYPQKADFTFYGGIYRPVSVIAAPALHFSLSFHGTTGLKVTPLVSRDGKSANVTLEAWLEGPDAAGLTGRDVRFIIEDQDGNIRADGIARSDAKGHAGLTLTLDPVHLWDGVEDPYLYAASAELENGDRIRLHFGCRSYEIDPEKGFLLNGRSYPLRGVAMHQDHKGIGNAWSRERMDQDMAIIRELGANTLRLAHYQHSQYFYDLCDRNGIVVWAEIPFITAFMAEGEQNTMDLMTDLVLQNYHHPSIVVWGLSNEITAASPVTEALLENHRRLNALCHRLDPTRRTTMADVFMLETDSPILDIPDVNSYNLYYGWYVGEMSETDEFFDEFHQTYPERAIGLSEYGADANPQFQAEKPEKGDYTEGYQLLYHEHMLQMIEKRPYLWATHVWNLFDFAADGRDEGGKHGENQKGLVTFDRKIKKDAFYLYKAAWNKAEAFVHICGRRYVKRECERTEIKVLSNQPTVSLYVNGEKVAEQTGKTVFRFTIDNVGTQWIAARAGDAFDQIQITRVAGREPSYIFNAAARVSNWFDADEIDPGFWSVNDKMGELQQDPKAGEVVRQVMDKARAARGDVAEATRDNPVLKKMIAKMTFIGLLKQAGAGEEQVKQLNRILQEIPKEVTK